MRAALCWCAASASVDCAAISASFVLCEVLAIVELLLMCGIIIMMVEVHH